MMIPNPYLLSSNKTFVWTLEPQLKSDFFAFHREGPAALLLIGMHLAESMPWICARNPVHMVHAPGIIDSESKRILGKRYRQQLPAIPSMTTEAVDPIKLVLATLDGLGHSFQAESGSFPQILKTPGKLVPRRLTATAHVAFDDQEFQLYSRNFAEVSQCLHAELTLIFALSQRLSQAPRPPAALREFRLETTLKPCKMCAAFLHIVKGRCQSFLVRYQEDDPGPLAAQTMLDRFGYQSEST